MKALTGIFKLLGIMVLALVLVSPDAEAQRVKKRKLYKKPRKCAHIGKIKGTRKKMSRQMRQQLASKYANNNLNYNKVTTQEKATKKTNLQGEPAWNVSQQSETLEQADQLETAQNLEASEKGSVLLQQNSSNQAESKQTETLASKTIVLEEDKELTTQKSLEEKNTASEKAEEKKRTGSLWYTSDKPIPPELEALLFETDEEGFSEADMKILQEAARQTRYGFVLELEEHFSSSDVDEGKNIPYKRANRLKSMLVHKLGIDANAIYIKSYTDNNTTDKKRIEIVLKN